SRQRPPHTWWFRAARRRCRRQHLHSLPCPRPLPRCSRRRRLPTRRPLFKVRPAPNRPPPRQRPPAPPEPHRPARLRSTRPPMSPWSQCPLPHLYISPPKLRTLLCSTYHLSSACPHSRRPVL